MVEIANRRNCSRVREFCPLIRRKPDIVDDRYSHSLSRLCFRIGVYSLPELPVALVLEGVTLFGDVCAFVYEAGLPKL